MQFFPTAVYKVTAWRHKRLRAHWLMALVGAGKMYVFCVPAGIAASPISLLSMGGVCGRSLTEGKILFTGRQTCSLYLVLWLCGSLDPVVSIITLCVHRVIILNRGSMFAFPWREFSPPLSSAEKDCSHRRKRDRKRCNYRGTQNTYFSLSAPPPPQTRPISQWTRSLNWRHAVKLHILIEKMCITFFPYSCEVCSLYQVLWLCAVVIVLEVLFTMEMLCGVQHLSRYTSTIVGNMEVVILLRGF